MADATIIQAETAISGRVAGESSLVVHGTIRGSIEITETLTIGESGYVEGDVSAHEIVVEGTVQGDLKAQSRIVLLGTARAVATLHAPLLEMAEGAQLKGEVNVGVDGDAPARTSASSSASRASTSRMSAVSRPAASRSAPSSTSAAAPSTAASSATTTVTVVEEEEPEPVASEVAEVTDELEGSVEEIREDYTVKELREELRRRDLAVSGTKDELIERLLEAQAEEADA